MKYIVVIMVALVALGCNKSEFGSEYHEVEHDGNDRKYLLHVPENYDDQADKSAIIALHGGVGSPKNIEEQSLLSVLSDEEGFLVCYPEGYSRTWNGGGCCGKARDKGVDDVGFIRTVIDELIDEQGVDPNRIFVTGLSNGAFMSYRLACELSDKIAAIAPVGGTMTIDHCDPSNAVPVIHFHSLLDENIPYTGGIGDGISDHYNSPLDSVLGAWAAHNGCQPQATTVAGTNVEVTTWSDCSGMTSSVVLYMSADGGHSWPSGTKPWSKADEPSTAVNANELMWAFFQEAVQ